MGCPKRDGTPVLAKPTQYPIIAFENVPCDVPSGRGQLRGKDGVAPSVPEHERKFARVEVAQIACLGRGVTVVEEVEVGRYAGRRLLPDHPLGGSAIYCVAYRRPHTFGNFGSRIRAQEGRREVATTTDDPRLVGRRQWQQGQLPLDLAAVETYQQGHVRLPAPSEHVDYLLRQRPDPAVGGQCRNAPNPAAMNRVIRCLTAGKSSERQMPLESRSMRPVRASVFISAPVTKWYPQKMSSSE